MHAGCDARPRRAFDSSCARCSAGTRTLTLVLCSRVKRSCFGESFHSCRFTRDRRPARRPVCPDWHRAAPRHRSPETNLGSRTSDRNRCAASLCTRAAGTPRPLLVDIAGCPPLCAQVQLKRQINRCPALPQFADTARFAARCWARTRALAPAGCIYVVSTPDTLSTRSQGSDFTAFAAAGLGCFRACPSTLFMRRLSVGDGGQHCGRAFQLHARCRRCPNRLARRLPG